MNALLNTIAVLFIGFLVWFLIIVPLWGLHIITNNGEHTGYITAVETSGLFFKTHNVYMKTDTQSSQEDIYCVTDDNVFSQLKDLQEEKEKVTVSFIGWFSNGIAYCGLGGDIITGIK